MEFWANGWHQGKRAVPRILLVGCLVLGRALAAEAELAARLEMVALVAVAACTVVPVDAHLVTAETPLHVL